MKENFEVAEALNALTEEIVNLKKENARLNRDNKNLKNRLAKAQRIANQRYRDDYEIVDLSDY